ncbi:CARDB domain-containing protein [Methanobrevibacter filiformis]|uniref:Big-1 domain-containing protein n=1 Tax=Methanobrevibacter filiformis TaxID=55758 RepID=A0A166EV13_9EURY|nr:Ig-like domain repeat protein [Methanobrevibacter filiformis]KZX17043.1 hypothetical protein MBFIL_03940 [Methanobrevibacter filiformis]
MKFKSNILILVLLAVFIVCSVQSVSAANSHNFTTDDNFDTKFADVVNGDTFTFKAGSYNLTSDYLINKKVNLVAENEVIINSGDYRFNFASESNGSSVKGFVFLGDSNNPKATTPIATTGPTEDITINNNTFKYVYDGVSFGRYATNNFEFTNNIIDGFLRDALNLGGGSGHGDVYIVNNIIKNNLSAKDGIAIAYKGSGNLTINNNTISNVIEAISINSFNAPDLNATVIIKNNIFDNVETVIEDPNHSEIIDSYNVFNNSGESSLTHTPKEPANIIINSTISKSSISKDGSVNYTVKITNSGNRTADNITLTITLPNSLKYVKTISKTTGDYKNNEWTITALDAGSSATLSLTLNAKSTGKQTIKSSSSYLNGNETTPKEGQTTTILSVNKLSTKITVVVAKSAILGSTSKFKITVKDKNGKVLANKNIKVKVNSKIYTGKTNSNGIATVNAKISNKGKYNVKISFAGTSDYSASSKSVQHKVTASDLKIAGVKRIGKNYIVKVKNIGDISSKSTKVAISFKTDNKPGVIQYATVKVKALKPGKTVSVLVKFYINKIYSSHKRNVIIEESKTFKEASYENNIISIRK